MDELKTHSLNFVPLKQISNGGLTELLELEKQLSASKGKVWLSFMLWCASISVVVVLLNSEVEAKLSASQKQKAGHLLHRKQISFVQHVYNRERSILEVHIAKFGPAITILLFIVNRLANIIRMQLFHVFWHATFMFKIRHFPANKYYMIQYCSFKNLR